MLPQFLRPYPTSKGEVFILSLVSIPETLRKQIEFDLRKSVVRNPNYADKLQFLVFESSPLLAEINEIAEIRIS